MRKVFNNETGEYDYLPDDAATMSAKIGKPISLPSPILKTKDKLAQSEEGGTEVMSGAERVRKYRLRHGNTYRKANAEYMRKYRARQKSHAEGA